MKELGYTKESSKPFGEVVANIEKIAPEFEDGHIVVPKIIEG